MQRLAGDTAGAKVTAEQGRAIRSNRSTEINQRTALCFQQPVSTLMLWWRSRTWPSKLADVQSRFSPVLKIR